MISERRSFVIAASLAALAAGAGPLAAEDFPSRNVTVIVPFAAGGPSDSIARLLAQSLGQTLRQQVVIENVAGAGGTAGAARVAKSEPDGHTLLIHHLALPAGASLYKSLPYDTRSAFEPLGLVNTGPMVLVAKKDFPPRNARELFGELRARGDKTLIAHAGIGSNAHICGVLLAQSLGFRPTFVSYRGTGPAMNDVVAGQVDLLCDQSTNAVPQIEGGTVRAHAVTSKERLDVLKEVPTAAEVGLPAFDLTIWHGLYAPKGVGTDRAEILHAALQKALADPAVIARFAAVGTSIYPAADRSREAHRIRFLGEIDRIAALMSAAGVQPQ